jgi:hypothetical protein
MRAFFLLFCACCGTGLSAQAEPWHAGPLFDHFNLTLDPGERTEAVGPFYYSEQKDSQHLWAVPPLFSWTRDPDVDSEEIDFAYPILTYDRYGEQYRWQLFQLFSFAGGPSQEENARHRFTLFPIYFQQRSSDPSQNYTAFFPFYGHLQNRLFKDEMFFVMFPIYGHTRKKDVVTDNYLYPFFHIRHGDGLSGWQFWPFYGQEHKDVTTRTNGFKEIETVAGHDKMFILSPFYSKQKTGIGTENPVWNVTSLPAFSLERSPKRDVTTVIWPFFSRIDDREKKYREWQVPWPFLVFARGEGKTTTRVFPIFSQAHNATLESDFYLWPVYKFNRIHSDPLDRKRTRIALFLYSDINSKNTETGAYERRVDFWPFYTWKHDFNGNTRLQVLAALEPYLPNNRSIERDYSPIWSFWRSEKNPRTESSSQSLLWNLYRRDAAPGSKKCSLLFGLFQYQSDAKGTHLRLFYVPMTKSSTSATPPGVEPAKK